MNEATLSLIKRYEGLHDGNLNKIGLQPKLCPAGIWTEGYGRAMIDKRTGKFLKGIENESYANSNRTITNEDEATIALNKDLAKYATMAANAVGNSFWLMLNENQRGALTSFVYNCGLGTPYYSIFSNIRKYIKKEITKDDLYSYWCKSVIKSNGKVLKGLVLRRKSEAQLFFS